MYRTKVNFWWDTIKKKITSFQGCDKAKIAQKGQEKKSKATFKAWWDLRRVSKTHYMKHFLSYVINSDDTKCIDIDHL